ncbi:HAD family hydrolase [Commensalibacter papalotli (ex Servin-Garciduenas et al. 2014)]|uniref:Hydrolase n=1 Tax=Commensalibacter papalotli (ex Servin-Garciduenas et al. 2014) TaxID=1208583 RepID=W7DKN8_9PROT|nr:HAD family phosphatase [Commensalibacter papalotli (ex Servin-Garciduenas et al. 2014)]EUK17902.1 hydrolase [Commensalibacter papalotli (ex Servin-Garciduenas et al. 2014)]
MREDIKKAIAQAPKGVHADGQLKLVIFDCDGVLVESEHLVGDVLGKEARKHGWNITGPEARALFTGVQLVDIEKEMKKHVTMPLPIHWREHAHDLIVEAMHHDIHPIEGVETILQTLKDLNIPYRIGSNSSHEEMKIKFNTSKLTHWFEKDRTHSGCDMERPKPFPDLYLHAAEQEGVNPEDCIVVEDSDTGLKAAYDAGSVCILLRDLDKPAPDYRGLIRVASLNEATDFIKEVVQSQKK